MYTIQHIVILISILLSVSTLSAQDYSWAKEISGISTEEPIASVTDAQGNTIVAGIYTSQTLNIGGTTLVNSNDNETFFDIFLVRYDPSGNVLWAKTAGSVQHDYVRDLAIDAAGNIYMTGYFGDMADFDGTILETAENFVSESFLIKYNSDGIIQWIKQSQGSHFENFPITMAVDPSGDIYVCGNTLFSDFNLFGLDYTDEGDWDGYVLKLDTDGNVLWLKEFWFDDTPTITNNLTLSEVTTSTDGSRFCIAGNFTGIYDFGGVVDTSRVAFTNLNQSIDVFTTCFDADGELLWHRSEGSYEFGGGNSISGLGMDSNNNTYLTGTLGGILYFENGDSIYVNDPSFNDAELYLMKYSDTGSRIWTEQVAAQNNNANVEPEDLVVSPEGNVYLTGYYEWDPLFGNLDLPLQTHAMFVAKYNSDGQAQWAKSGSTSLGSEGMALSIDADQNIYATGHYTFEATFGNTIMSNAGLRGTFVVKIGEGSNSTFDQSLASKWSVYPNPADQAILIKTDVEISQDTRIDILDQLGRLMTTITFDSPSKQIDISALEAGAYFAASSN